MRPIHLLPLLFSSLLFGQEADKRPDYLNPTLPLARRVDDLVSRMTLEEKISQMVHDAKAIPRLGVPEYNWWNECLHGVARAGTATVFPQAIGLAATWDTDLMHQVADVISTEARAKYHDFIRRGQREIFKGLTFWSPNINIFRDPRWGRGQETYGEDPYLTARLGVQFVEGLQGDDTTYFKVIATPKHFAVHSGPEPARHQFDAEIDKHDLYDTYLPAFEACVREAGAYSVMCAYNRLDGKACCGSTPLLQDILRHDWGFQGYVVSDCGAVDDIYRTHKLVATGPEAAALAVKAGTDLNCGDTYSLSLLQAVRQGLIPEEEITRAVTRLFTARFRLGMFDPDDEVKYAQIPIDENDSPAHRRLALRAARESIVLLKNANGFLPLHKDVKRIAVVGPTADSYAMLLGNYNGTPSSYVTPFGGIRRKLGGKTEVVYEPGCDLVEEGGIVYSLSGDLLSTDGGRGLRAEYFDNSELKGTPFFSRVDPMISPNWIWGTRVPAFPGRDRVSSVRWTGMLKAPASGDFEITLKGDGGCRFELGDTTRVDAWDEQDFASRKVIVRLEEGRLYPVVVASAQRTQWPSFSVQWKALHVDHTRMAVDLARKADVVIFVGGITSQLEGEEMRVDYEGFKGGDRTDISLPKVQEKLLRALFATGTPVVLVLTSGSALAVNWEDKNLAAIVQLWYPGEEGGTALADVLFGDYNPAGRLPVTYYTSVDQLPPFEDYQMKGRTYRYFAGKPLYPFGYGLSYTRFRYDNLEVPAQSRTGENLTVSVEVQNAGSIAGDEVVQLYVTNMSTSFPAPLRSLQGFKRVHLAPGQRQVVKFLLHPRQLAVLNEQVKWVVNPDTLRIAVGGILPGAVSPTTEYITKEVRLTGRRFIVP